MLSIAHVSYCYHPAITSWLDLILGRQCGIHLFQPSKLSSTYLMLFWWSYVTFTADVYTRCINLEQFLGRDRKKLSALPSSPGLYNIPRRFETSEVLCNVFQNSTAKQTGDWSVETVVKFESTSSVFDISLNNQLYQQLNSAKKKSRLEGNVFKVFFMHVQLHLRFVKNILTLSVTTHNKLLLETK